MAAASARYPDRTAVVDEHGSHTYAELWAETNAVAHGLLGEGVTSGATVGILHRNSYRFVSSVVAAAKVGASTVFLNTEHAAPQVAGVVESEGIDVVLHDRELAELVADLPIQRFDSLALAAFAQRLRRATPRLLDEQGARSSSRRARPAGPRERCERRLAAASAGERVGRGSWSASRFAWDRPSWSRRLCFTPGAWRGRS